MSPNRIGGIGRTSRRWATPVTVLLLAAALAGCTAGSDDPIEDIADGAGELPTLYLNVTVGNETHRFSTADGGLPGGGGDGGDGNGSLSATATSSSGTVSAGGNATGGNGTAQGNATAGNGTGSAGGGVGGAGGMPGGGTPSGEAPLDVTVEVGASGLPDAGDDRVSWSIDWGEAAGTSGGNGSAGAYGNGSAAMQQMKENGTQLPARLQHTYANAGRFDLTFVVEMAGEKLGTLGTPVVVGQGGPTPGTPLGVVPFNATGDFPPSPPLVGCSEESGEEFPWTFQDSFNGTPAEVQNASLTLATSGMVYESSMHLVAPNGTILASSDGDELEAEGPFEAGDYVVRVVGCGSAGGSFDVEGVASYVAADRQAT